MFYSSRLGNLQYFDFVLYKTQRCDPTMLFILGLESVINPINDTDFIVIHKNTVPDIFDGIYTYLFGNLPDPALSVESIEFNCFGLKRFLNILTGTDYDRVIPCIYHDSYNDLPLYENKLEEILNIFKYAGYDKLDSEVHYIGIFGLSDQAAIDSVVYDNQIIKAEHEKAKQYSQLYKLIDYKAVYQYALGVLYGCTCIGYLSSLVFSNSTDWYDGQYDSLIRTASAVFNFHYNHVIKKIDSDPRLFEKYKGTGSNSIWNFTDNVLGV